MNKILFIIPSLAGGGAERLLTHLLRHLKRDSFEKVAVIFEKRIDYKDIPEDVRIICLNKKRAIDFFKVIISLGNIIRKERPSLIHAHLTYANYLTVLARYLSKYKVPLILTEHTHLGHNIRMERFCFLKKELIKKLYPKASRIVAVSNGVKRNLVEDFGICEEKIKVIYNPVDITLIEELAKEEVGHPWFKEESPIIVACGRLVAPKNYPLLLRSFQRVLRETDAKLIIIGEGEARKSLESLTTFLGIEKSVAFLGFKYNPFKYIARSDIFVLSSNWEGFGNVLIEAMACGVPVISTRCPSGPDEIITNGVNGLLVPVGDEGALTEAILRLLQDKGLRERLAKAGRKRAEDLRVEKIIGEYEKLFNEAINVQ